jgi:drug/metabolite transporter (DMT)-like permease
MENTILYLVSILIWGSTWFVITFQLNVAPELSVAYRFFLAAGLLFAYIKWRKLNLAFSWRQHAYIAVAGLLLFSANYILVYYSELYITSGLVSVLFSTVTIMNVFFSALFLKTPLRAPVVLGSVIGTLGVAIIFWPELASFQAEGNVILGFVMVIGSAFSASLGNIMSARNQKTGLPVIQTNMYGMFYGATATFLFALVRGAPLTFDPSASYVAALLYLALFGSVIGFGAYLTLLGRIGPDRAGYIGVAIPVVALLLSALFESLSLEPLQLAGVALVILGNAFVLYQRSASRVAVPASK